MTDCSLLFRGESRCEPVPTQVCMAVLRLEPRPAELSSWRIPWTAGIAVTGKGRHQEDLQCSSVSVPSRVAAIAC